MIWSYYKIAQKHVMLSAKRIVCISIELIPYSLWIYVCHQTEVKLHMEASQKCRQTPLLQILKAPLVKYFRLQWEFNANVALYCRWYMNFFSYCIYFLDLSTSVVVQPTSYQMVCCVSKLCLTCAVRVGIHYVITNLNNLFLLKTKHRFCTLVLCICSWQQNDLRF